MEAGAVETPWSDMERTGTGSGTRDEGEWRGHAASWTRRWRWAWGQGTRAVKEEEAREARVRAPGQGRRQISEAHVAAVAWVS